MFRLVAALHVTPALPERAGQLFEHFLAQQHSVTRRAAIQAIAYGGWPESLDTLERVAKQDGDESVRSFASGLTPGLKALLAKS